MTMEALRLRKLLEHTLANRPWWVLLEFRRTDDEVADWSLLSASLRALEDGHRIARVISDLREHALAVVFCDSEEEVRRLLGGIRARRLWVWAYASGRLTGWQPPEPKRCRRRK
jgi:hypothetical protein